MWWCQVSVLEEVNSLESTAEYLKLSPRKVRNLANSKQLGHIREGQTLTFPRDAIEAYKEAHTIAAIPVAPHGLTRSAARRVRGAA